MILKFISTKELNFHDAYVNGIKKIKLLSNFDRYMTIFWILGPFIYLIERDPADLWLTIIGIVFLFKCYLTKNWGWIFQWWFKFTLLFWVTCLVSGLFSQYPSDSFSSAFVWIRFPIYVAAAQVWLARDKDIRILILISLGLGMLIMSSILFAESVIAPKTRLTWPYGDLIPGAYLAKTSLPVICILSAVIFKSFNKSSFLFSLIILFVSMACLLTGERVNFLILICSIFLSGIIFKQKLINFIVFKVMLLIVLFSTILINPNLSNRYFTHFYKSIPILNFENKVDGIPNPYWGVWRSGIQQAFTTPILGIGPSGLRKNCKYLDSKALSWLPGRNHCGNHPHNFYIQLFAETGFIGFIFGTLMMISIIWKCYETKNISISSPMLSSLFIVPLALFFPFQQFGNFFGQWGNLFIWFAIGIVMSCNQNYKKLS